MRTKTVKILNLKIATKAARARIREKARQEFLAGSTVYAAARKLLVTPQTMSNWFRQFRESKGRMYTEKRRGPAPGHDGKLDAGRRKQLSRVLEDKTPDQLKFDFALWSSKAIKEYVKDFFQVDICRVHHANDLREWFAQMREERGFRIFYLPSYSPELNPDEYFNRDIKACLAEQRIPRSAEELGDAIQKHVDRRSKDPEAIRRLFEKEEVRYAASD